MAEDSAFVELGDEVLEKVTLLRGVVVCVSLSLSGCRQVAIQPRGAKEGKPSDCQWFDDSRCEIKKKGAVAVSPRFAKAEGGAHHGPRPSTR